MSRKNELARAHRILARGYRELAVATDGPGDERYRWRARQHKELSEKLSGKKYLGYFLPGED